MKNLKEKIEKECVGYTLKGISKCSTNLENCVEAYLRCNLKCIEENFIGSNSVGGSSYLLMNFDGMDNEGESARIEVYIHDLNINFEFDNYVEGEEEILEMFQEINKIIKLIEKINSTSLT